MSYIFKYAGIDGAGDKDKFLTEDDDTSTRRTIKLARDVEKEPTDGSRALPVIISYTCNISLGDIYEQLRQKEWLTHSFANLILALNIDDHPVPAGFIVNPDFLGEGQKANLMNHGVPVREPLRGALAHCKVEADSITDNFAGLISGAAALVTDVVSSDYDSEHWGTGGSYLLGDADISSDCQNINPRVMSLNLNATLIKADTAAEVWQRGEPFDLSQPAYQDFPLRGIFTVLLGGGSTTGVISTVGNAGPWVIDRLNAYAADSIKLDDTSSDGSNAKAKCSQATQWGSRLWEEWRGVGNA